jgi:hypothetical protein
MFAERIVLPPHGGQILDLGNPRGKVVVPHERELFGQRIRAEEHAVEPPRL